MCSVTFWPRRGGYIVGMNRDESLARVRGLPPARADAGEVHVLHPREPAGGTWISVNDRGVAFALVNWYAITARAPRPVVSRGEVVAAMRAALTSAGAGDRFGRLGLARMDPFRLIGFFPRGTAHRGMALGRPASLPDDARLDADAMALVRSR